MPRSFDMATVYDCGADAVLRAFRDEDYWRARLAGSGADEARLDDFAPGHDGGVDVVTTQVLRAARLPKAVHQLHRGDLHIRRAETWTGVVDGAAEATVASSILAAPVALLGSAGLEPAEPGTRSRLTFRGTVEVRIPLVGGKLEKFIGSRLLELISAEQRFTTRWIAEHR